MNPRPHKTWIHPCLDFFSRAVVRNLNLVTNIGDCRSLLQKEKSFKIKTYNKITISWIEIGKDSIYAKEQHFSKSALLNWIQVELGTHRKGMFDVRRVEEVTRKFLVSVFSLNWMDEISGDTMLKYWCVCTSDPVLSSFPRTKEEEWYSNGRVTSLWSST